MRHVRSVHDSCTECTCSMYKAYIWLVHFLSTCATFYKSHFKDNYAKAAKAYSFFSPCFLLGLGLFPGLRVCFPALLPDEWPFPFPPRPFAFP